MGGALCKSDVSGGPAPQMKKVYQSYRYVLLGGGSGAGYAAREFVRKGLQPDELCIVTAESNVSYERAPLTKEFLAPSSNYRLPAFHTCVAEGGMRQLPNWYKEKGIDYRTKFRVVSVDFEEKSITSESGETIYYTDALILATGSRSITLNDVNIPGGKFKGVHTIRNVEDAQKLVDDLERVKAKKGTCVVIGGGYIGIEVAATVKDWGIETMMVFPESRLLARAFDVHIGDVFEREFTNQGVRLERKAKVTALLSEDGVNVSAVQTTAGTFPADLVVCGIGARPNIEMYKGVKVHSELGGVKVDGNMRTNIPGVYAVGDIAAFPLKFDNNRYVRQEHGTHARRSAEHAVCSIYDPNTPAYDYLPFFYSREFGFAWKLWGLQRGEVVHFGDLEPGHTFGAYYIDNGKVVGAFLEGGSMEDAEVLKALVRNKVPVEDKEAIEGPNGLPKAKLVADRYPRASVISMFENMQLQH